MSSSNRTPTQGSHEGRDCIPFPRGLRAHREELEELARISDRLNVAHERPGSPRARESLKVARACVLRAASLLEEDLQELEADAARSPSPLEMETELERLRRLS